MIMSLTVVVSLLLNLSLVKCYPRFVKCYQSLSPGTVFMGAPAVSDSTRSIVVQRGSKIVASGDKYVYGETVQVTLPTTGGVQYLLQTSNNAVLIGGECSQTRLANPSTANLVLPSASGGNVTLIAGWAPGYGVVSITNPFILNDPFGNAGAADTSKIFEYKSHPTKDLIVGLVVGIGGVLIISAILSAYIYRLKQGDPSIRFSLSFKARTFSLISIVCAITAMGLVIAWLRNTNSNQQYMGVPSLKSNVFAYHPPLMVGGFFCAQVFAILCWSLISDHVVAKRMHVTLQAVAVVTMSLGLAAVVKYKWDSKLPSLTTMHSWAGVATIAVFGTNFLVGSLMAILTQWFPSSILRSALDMKTFHKGMGMSSVALCAITISTGVMDQLQSSSCDYNIGDDVTLNSVDYNPAENYPLLPNGCKIANGMGIAVLVSAIFVAITVFTREHTVHRGEPKDHNESDPLL